MNCSAGWCWPEPTLRDRRIGWIAVILLVVQEVPLVRSRFRSVRTAAGEGDGLSRGVIRCDHDAPSRSRFGNH
jgi:hypothetical protein